MFGVNQFELLILLLVVMLLFGSAKLPTLMRNLGRSANEFKKGIRDGTEDAPDSTSPKHDSSKHDSIS
jgi:sec-independent protein translocase protein TatA